MTFSEFFKKEIFNYDAQDRKDWNIMSWAMLIIEFLLPALLLIYVFQGK